MINVPPQFTSSPQLYAMYLKSQGVPTMSIIQMVNQQFGAPKTKQQVAEEQASDEQKSGIAKTIVSLAGMYGASKIGGLFGGGATGAGTTAATTAGTAGTAGAAGGLAGAGAGYLADRMTGVNKFLCL